jgi:hypothetical protein
MDELKTILHEELQKLPAKYRLPLILHYFGGLSRDEMAAELNCKASTLGVRIFRGREMLAGRLSGRGINISSTALAMLMGYAIKRVVSDSLIASTSHTATAMLAGYDGSGMASANVIGLTRRASNALVIGKVKLAAMSLLIAGTSLGAGAKALQILPAGTLQRIISNQIRRLVQPILLPISRPMLSQAPATPATPSNSTDLPANDLFAQTSTPSARPAAQISIPVASSAAPSSGQPVAVASTTSKTPQPTFNWNATFVPAPPAAANPVGTALTSQVATIADQIAGGSNSGGGAGIGSGGSFASAPQSPAAGRSYASNTAAAEFAQVVFGSNSLTIAPAQHVGTAGGLSSAGASNSSGSNLTQSPTATILVPSTAGTITETNTGLLRGWGTPTESGRLVMSGVAVADGGGIDRTLNFTHFSSIQTAGNAATVQATGLQIATSANMVAVVPSNDIASQTTLSAGVSMSASTSTASTGKLAGSSAGTSSSGSGTSGNAASVGSTLSPSASAGASTGNSVGFDSVSFVAANSGVAGSDASVPITVPATTATTLPPRGTIAPPLNGWYAVDHGRLCMNLQPSASSPTVLSWGESANGSLSLINSVQVSINGDPNQALPSELSLVSPDRDDLVNLSEITGATIGLWTVDPAIGSIANADLEVHYDTLLANALGADPGSIDLWALNGQTDQWSPVDQSSLLVDAPDSLVFGSAQDFTAFAVSAIPAPGADIEFIRAHQLAMINDAPMLAHHDAGIGDGIASFPSAGAAADAVASRPASSSIPEPVGLPLLAVGLGLLGRRRRK